MPRSSFTTYTSFTNPTDVSSGTTLSASLYNASLGSYGNLQYLYEALSPFYGGTAYYDPNITFPEDHFYPGYTRLTKSINQSIPNVTWTAIDFDVVSGYDYYNYPNQLDTNSPYVPSKTLKNYPQIPQLVIVNFNVMFATNATGTRLLRIIPTANGGSIDNIKYHFILANNATTANNNTTISICTQFIHTPTDENQSFSLSASAWQDSGGALNIVAGFTFLTAVKIPLV